MFRGLPFAFARLSSLPTAILEKHRAHELADNAALFFHTTQATGVHADQNYSSQEYRNEDSKDPISGHFHFLRRE